MKVMIYWVLLNFYFGPISTLLNQNELKISFDLIRELKIRQCILVQNSNKEDLIFDIKAFSSENVPISYLNYSRLINYALSTDNVDFRTGVISKEEDFNAMERVSQIFEKANQTYKLRNFIWFTFLGNQIKKVETKRLIIPYDCEFIVIQSKNEETTYKLTEIYTVKGKFFSLDFGSWNQNFRLEASNVSFYRRRFNFQKSEIRVLTDNDTLVTYGHSPRFMQTNDTISGLAYMMNLTIVHDVSASVSEAYAKVDQIGDIFDVSVLFDLDYYPPVDKLGPIFKVIINWYIKYPRVELRSDYYLQPFDVYLWIVWLTFLLLGTVLALITQNWIQNEKRFVIDNLFLGLESFCNQCGNDEIENSSLRVICISLRLIALIWIGVYGAIITSFLAVEIVQVPFKNVEEFLANGEYRLITNKGSAFDLFLKTSGIFLHKKIYKNFTKYIGTDHHEELLKNICIEKYATSGFNNYVYLYDLPCRIFKIPEHIGVNWYCIILQKNSPFTKIFSKNLIRFYEIGFQMRFKTMENNLHLQVSVEDPFEPIKIEQMSQVLMIPFAGILLGMTIFFFELMKRRRYLRKIRYVMVSENVGRLFGRPDVERCDLFIDAGFLDWGPYDLPGGKPHEKRQMLAGGPQTKCAIQKLSGYFETDFKTINVGVKFVEPSQLQGRTYKKPEKGEWKPTGPSKKHATPGDVYGTFASTTKAFSPLTRTDKKTKEIVKNFYTKPGKKGNCGYVDITMNKYPEHKVDDYDKAQELYSENWRKHKKLIRAGSMTTTIYPRPYFDSNPYQEEDEPGPTYVPKREKSYGQSRGNFVPPGYPKKPGNNHDGCFEKFPSWQEEPYLTLKEVGKILTPVNVEHAGKIIHPPPQIKSYYISSVVNNKIDYCCNERTWRTMKPITYQ